MFVPSLFRFSRKAPSRATVVTVARSECVAGYFLWRFPPQWQWLSLLMGIGQRRSGFCASIWSLPMREAIPGGSEEEFICNRVLGSSKRPS